MDIDKMFLKSLGCKSGKVYVMHIRTLILGCLSCIYCFEQSKRGMVLYELKNGRAQIFR